MKINPAQHIIDFGSRKIPYRLHRKERKHLRIVVSPELTVDIFAPRSAGDEQVQEALKKKIPWILRTLEKLKNGSRQPAKLLGRFLWVWVADKTDAPSVKRSVEGWYRKRARETLGRYVEKCYRIASRHGVPEPNLVIRRMTRRWGSCSPSGRITLNLKLVCVPVHCIEYVIMHEICHLKQSNHSKAFYSLLTRCLPDWRRRKETLDKFRLS
jgi:predicted metal-dependent hydrolase